MGKMQPPNPGNPQNLPKSSTQIRIMPAGPKISQRPASVAPIRGASINRVIAREIRRETFLKGTAQKQTPPQYAVRPMNPPLKVMPKIPAPVQVNKTPLPIRASVPPSGGLKISIKPAITLAPIRPPTGKLADKPGTQASRIIFLQPTANIHPTGPAMSTAAIAALTVNVAAANPQISAEVSSLNSSLEDLKSRSSLGRIADEVSRLDSDLTHTINLLEGARQEGYVYQKDIDEIAYRAMDQWQGIKGKLEVNIPQQAAAFQVRLRPLGNQLVSLNRVLGNPTAATALLRDTSSQVNTLLSDLSQVESTLEDSFAEVRDQTSDLLARLNLIHWSMDQLNQAKFKLDNDETLVIAVQSRWDQEGDKDPEGVLYLTNHRMIFERKEKVATKKILFITTAQELVQEVLIDQKLDSVPSEKAVHKGLFGNQDFLEVKFSDPKLADVSFHLNGQDCVQWTTWIQKAKSGEIENDRTTGSGLSFSDITGPLTTADLLALQNEVNSLQELVTLKPVREELGKIENDMRSLERTLANLRARGYTIEKRLESDVIILAAQWERIKTNADTALLNQTKLLDQQMEPIKTKMSVFAGKSDNINEARPIYLQIKSAIASTEAQADAADDVVIATYDQYADEIESMSAHLEWVNWMLDALSSASFQLLATESGIAATEATWVRPGLEPENGILFLTDQRLVWEDRVDTYELKVNQAITQVTSINKVLDDNTRNEALVFELANSDPYPSVRFTLNLPVADAWVKMFGRARSGEYNKDRAIEIDPAELERIKNAPQQCSNCGAGLTSPILRGQSDIICEYCGQVTRI